MERRQRAFGLASLARAVSEGGTGGEISDLLDGDVDRQGRLTGNQSKTAVLLRLLAIRCASSVPEFEWRLVPKLRGRLSFRGFDFGG
jgi:hypothetical protein